MNQLPEPNFINRDAEAITNEWIALYEEKSGKVLQPAQIERLMIDTGAYRENLLRIQIQKIAKENLLSYAPLDILEHIGEPLGVKKLLANCALTTLRFAVDEALEFDYIIPKGTEVETKDGLFVFETKADGILREGDLFVDVDAICETAGIAGNNYILKSINNLITPLSYISNVENTVVSYGGADDEDVENLRERIRQAPESFSNAGSKGAYKYHTLSAHQSITDVAILSPTPGVVEVYPLTKTGNPTADILEIVQAYLSDDKVRPLTDLVRVKSPEKIEFELKANITLFTDADSTSVMTTINAKLNEYKVALSEKLGKDVVMTQIISILNSVYGVFKVELRIASRGRSDSEDPFNASNQAITPSDIDILDYQWADLKNFEITIGGYANE